VWHVGQLRHVVPGLQLAGWTDRGHHALAHDAHANRWLNGE
jgi:hypothetical protein